MTFEFWLWLAGYLDVQILVVPPFYLAMFIAQLWVGAVLITWGITGLDSLSLRFMDLIKDSPGCWVTLRISVLSSTSLLLLMSALGKFVVPLYHLTPIPSWYQPCSEVLLPPVGWFPKTWSLAWLESLNILLQCMPELSFLVWNDINESIYFEWLNQGLTWCAHVDSMHECLMRAIPRRM